VREARGDGRARRLAFHRILGAVIDMNRSAQPG
jgi:hypothetical protein